MVSKGQVQLNEPPQLKKYIQHSRDLIPQTRQLHTYHRSIPSQRDVLYNQYEKDQTQLVKKVKPCARKKRGIRVQTQTGVSTVIEDIKAKLIHQRMKTEIDHALNGLHGTTSRRLHYFDVVRFKGTHDAFRVHTQSKRKVKEAVYGAIEPGIPERHQMLTEADLKQPFHDKSLMRHVTPRTNIYNEPNVFFESLDKKIKRMTLTNKEIYPDLRSIVRTLLSYAKAAVHRYQKTLEEEQAELFRGNESQPSSQPSVELEDDLVQVYFYRAVYTYLAYHISFADTVMPVEDCYENQASSNFALLFHHFCELSELTQPVYVVHGQLTMLPERSNQFEVEAIPHQWVVVFIGEFPALNYFVIDPFLGAYRLLPKEGITNAQYTKDPNHRYFLVNPSCVMFTHHPLHATNRLYPLPSYRQLALSNENDQAYAALTKAIPFDSQRVVAMTPQAFKLQLFPMNAKAARQRHCCEDNTMSLAYHSFSKKPLRLQFRVVSLDNHPEKSVFHVWENYHESNMVIVHLAFQYQGHYGVDVQFGLEQEDESTQSDIIAMPQTCFRYEFFVANTMKYNVDGFNQSIFHNVQYNDNLFRVEYPLQSCLEHNKLVDFKVSLDPEYFDGVYVFLVNVNQLVPLTKEKTLDMTSSMDVYSGSVLLNDAQPSKGKPYSMHLVTFDALDSQTFSHAYILGTYKVKRSLPRIEFDVEMEPPFDVNATPIRVENATGDVVPLRVDTSNQDQQQVEQLTAQFELDEQVPMIRAAHQKTKKRMKWIRKNMEVLQAQTISESTMSPLIYPQFDDKLEDHLKSMLSDDPLQFIEEFKSSIHDSSQHTTDEVEDEEKDREALMASLDEGGNLLKGIEYLKDHPDDVEMAYAIACHYLHDLEVMESGVRYMRYAAKLGHPEALHDMGVFYRDGVVVMSNLPVAKKFFKRSATMGSASALYSLGCLYYYGQGVERHVKRAVEYWEKAMLDTKDVLAHHNMGTLLLTGYKDIVAVDFERAYKLFYTAAERGYPLSWISIGWIYENGKGVPMDYPRALEFYNRAVRAGATIAYINIGNMHLQGLSGFIKRDRDTALEYFQKALAAGHQDAQRYVDACTFKQSFAAEIVEMKSLLKES